MQSQSEELCLKCFGGDCEGQGLNSAPVPSRWLYLELEWDEL